MGDDKRYKTDSVAKTRQLIDENPFQSKSGMIYAAPIINQAGGVSPSLKTKSLPAVGETVVLSPSGRRMREPRERQNIDAERKRVSRQEPDFRAAEREAMAVRREDPDYRAAEREAMAVRREDPDCGRPWLGEGKTLIIGLQSGRPWLGEEKTLSIGLQSF